jgi:ketosteroid isomerase-like protein
MRIYHQPSHFFPLAQRTLFTALCLSFLMMSISSAQSETKGRNNRENDIAMIEQAIHGSIGWAKNKDFSLLYRLVANDSDYVEIDPTPDIIRGFSEFKKNESFWASPHFKAIRYEIRDLNIHLSESGTVAWYSCILDDINEWKGKPASWMNTRWTGVLEKRSGSWVIVQMHFSFASSQQ